MRISQLSGKNPEAAPEDYIQAWKEKDAEDKANKDALSNKDKVFNEGKRQFDEEMKMGRGAF